MRSDNIPCNCMLTSRCSSASAPLLGRLAAPPAGSSSSRSRPLSAQLCRALFQVLGLLEGVELSATPQVASAAAATGDLLRLHSRTAISDFPVNHSVTCPITPPQLVACGSVSSSAVAPVTAAAFAAAAARALHAGLCCFQAAF